MNKYRAVIFDFDYTLANSESAIVRCFRTVLAAHGASPDDEAIKRTIGWTLEEAFGVLLGEHDPARLRELRTEYVAIADRHMVQGTEFYPDTLPLLRELKRRGYLTGVFSTKYRYRILASFERFGATDLIDDYVGGEDVSAHKPDPAGLLLWLSRNGVAAEAAVYVGDHTVDAQAALAAGVAFVGVAQGMTPVSALSVYPNLGIAEGIGNVLDFLGCER